MDFANRRVSSKPDLDFENTSDISMIYRTSTLFLALSFCVTAFGSDTLYFKLSNPWNTVKSPSGKYLRKCVKENNYYHCWDFNATNILVTESFYSDTNFTRKLFCHKYFNEQEGYLEQSRCYENGQLSGYFVDYNKNGDTTAYQVYKNGELLKEWSSDSDDNLVVFERIEESAEFPGGHTAWIKYLSDNLTYPKKLQKKNIHGQVLAKVYIDATGNVSNVEIIKSLHPTLDGEVVRVIKASPKWKPGKQNGKNVPVSFSQPISF